VQRLVTYSEEVAFNDPPGGMAEQFILNQHVRRLLRYSGLSALQRGVQQVCACRNVDACLCCGLSMDV
jgi:ATP-binding cassette subfamily D (ALD) protein 3